MGSLTHFSLSRNLMFKPFFLLAATAAVASAASCPDLPSLRSDYVKASFNASMLLGFWHEQAYIDIAQVGASCPTLNATFQGPTLDMAFKVDYGPVPFTIIEEYFSTNVTGYFIKQAKMPGAGLLKLPTAIVDVTLSSDRTQYETMILYSCTTKLGQMIPELIFASRQESYSRADLTKLEDTARAQGVKWEQSNLKYIDWASCK